METGQGATIDRTFTTRLSLFLLELSRRRVWRSTLAYAAVMFVLLQLGEILFPAFGAPDWALRLLVVSAFLGLPVVLCLAWIFDITPGGIRKTQGPGEGEGAGSGTGRALPRFALLAVTLATVGGLGWWTVRGTLEAAPVTAGAGNPGDAVPVATSEEMAPVRSIAVLPLDDFSEEEEGGFFTAGLHEEIVSRLSQAGIGRVVSRTSTVQYDRSGKTLPAIAEDLGVDAVVEGSVFRSGDRVRVTVQLIHGPTDTHLWAESYEGTIENALDFQRDVALSIARAIGEEIAGEASGPARSPRVAKGSPVPEAYRIGRKEEMKGTPEGLVSAIQHYRRALEEDSSFVPARTGLATAQIRLEGRADAGVDEPPPGDRVSDARRLAAASHFREAEGILLEVIGGQEEDRMASEAAWSALEQIRAIRGDLQGLVELRLSHSPGGIVPVGDSASLASLRTLIQDRGQEEYWVWKTEWLKERAEGGRPVSPLEQARAYVGIGNVEAAFPFLDEAVAQRDWNLVTLWTDPAWDDLRPDPRFQEILKRIRESVPGAGFPLPDEE